MIEREAGRGAMGIVYLAHDTRLGRQVALKALPEHLSSDAARLQRLEREARMLASLNHPNIASIYSLEEHGGRSYLVLEWAHGQPLESRLRQGRLEVGEAAALGRQLARALAAAHERGIIHRDLKPANVMVGPDGSVKVLDFGLAKSLSMIEPPSSFATATTGPETLPPHVALQSPQWLRSFLGAHQDAITTVFIDIAGPHPIQASPADLIAALDA